ncbi:MAG TPA: hypothetical protein VGZ29_03855 [Terriglobia bacterium]|nr:hypothetical protein [Terriglobia bacterium]
MLSALILVFSAALLLFYLQAACERIFQRRFEERLAEPIVEANKLSFPRLRRALETGDTPMDSAGFQRELKHDFVTLTYLLRNAGNQRRHLSGAERTGAIYFRIVCGLMPASRLFGMKGRSLLLKMASVLEFYANLLGERTKRVRFVQLATEQDRA